MEFVMELSGKLLNNFQVNFLEEFTENLLGDFLVQRPGSTLRETLGRIPRGIDCRTLKLLVEFPQDFTGKLIEPRGIPGKSQEELLVVFL